MKQTVLYTLVLTLLVFSMAVYLPSCRPDVCVTRAVDCKNGGTCHDGACICEAGYEGDSCQFRVNEKFQSLYACIQTRIVNGTINEDNDDTLMVKALNDRFSIRFYSIRDSVLEVITAKVNDNDIQIPTQKISFPGGYEKTYSGNGSMNKGVITITLFANWDNAGPKSTKTTWVGYKFD